MEDEKSIAIMENDLSVIEENHKSQILAIHENMQDLINQVDAIEVLEDDTESYKKAVELKRIVKATHVSVEKKRKELKQPVIDYGKRLDTFVKEIYEPLIEAEKVIKSKMEKYEARLEKIKEERRREEEELRLQEQVLEQKIQEINMFLVEINSAKSKQDLINIENKLDAIDINSFGKKSAEIGFIITQLKMTCSIAMRLFKEELVAENPSEDLIEKNTQEVLIKNEEGIFEEFSFPVTEFNPLENVQDFVEQMTEDEIIETINNVYKAIQPFVLDDIISRIKIQLYLLSDLDNKNLEEHREMIIEQVMIQLAILITKKSNKVLANK
jgi:hypothetical protein